MKGAGQLGARVGNLAVFWNHKPTGKKSTSSKAFQNEASDSWWTRLTPGNCRTLATLQPLNQPFPCGKWTPIRHGLGHGSRVTVDPDLQVGGFNGGFRAWITTGWWLTYPSEKYESQLGRLFPTEWTNKIHVPKQPEFVICFGPNGWLW